MALLTWVTLGLYTLSCRAGTTIWSGSFNTYPTAASFDNWSWGNEVGEYQWYIHGSQNTSQYLGLSPSFKNPADTSETNGLRLTVDATSTWNAQFERTELIPQTTQNLGTGNLFYHFSISHPSTNLPDSTIEHQICFFESHFTELKYGVGPNSSHLTWMVTGVSHWDTAFVPGTWYNFAYDIDFTAGTVGLWASTGSNPLVKVVQNVAAATSTNSADWHLGVLRISNTGTEDYYFSGVYIESGPVTTSIGTGSGSGTTSASSSTITTISKSTTISTTTTSSTTTASGPLQTQYGQCGGTGYNGPTSCQSPFTCKAISAPYYYQCL
ncbi:carbohydrate-binding module family 1 protein [Favolaschia claudopus]|uniref:Carbohydrate-binding module family 1 protein n=1 Tax=Favolaschia claudopus TaxID=2862362 RepID=A0AAW0DB21_9AGAR